MALRFLLTVSPISSQQFSPRTQVAVKPPYNAHSSRRVQFFVSASTIDLTMERRNANYKPTIWDDNFLQSLNSKYTGKDYELDAMRLKAEVRLKFDQTKELLSQLELIDVVQRLGVGYHFEKEIKDALDCIVSAKKGKELVGQDLHATALYFRLLREHGYDVSHDVFKSFQNKVGGGFKACIADDIKGMLSLYEASFLAIDGEDVLDEAQEYTRRTLKEIQGNLDPQMAKQVNHALELPLHWRLPRMEARWSIDNYKNIGVVDPLLLYLAKLDFNIVQAIHQQEIIDMSRWWKSTGLSDALPYIRDRLVECYLFACGFNSENLPNYGYCRKHLTKANQLITVIDDIYDVYGSLDELRLFTKAVERWDVNMMQDLPDYIKIAFLSLYNTTNEMGYDILKEKGLHIIPYLRKAWADLCNAYLVEATWYHTGHKPTLEEYLSNAWKSISGACLEVHIFFILTENITKEAIDYLLGYADLVRSSNVIFRLTNDSGTSTDELQRGDTLKSIQCYMNEKGVSEKDAREHINSIIKTTWKEMNKQRLTPSPFSKYFIDSAFNVARASQFVYEFGDGFGVPEQDTKDRVLSLFAQPIKLLEE